MQGRRIGRMLLVSITLVLIVALAATAQVTIDRTSLTNKVIAGYQGWFAHPGDGQPCTPVCWRHWSRDPYYAPGPGNYQTDIWPDVAEYDPGDLYTVPSISLRYGGTPKLFSSVKPGVTNVHFRWMQENQIDGVALQRFVCEIANDPNDPFQHHRDTVLQNVRNASVTYGRAWCVEYDVTGTDPSVIYNRITTDWTYLKNTFGVTNHSRYLYHNSKPVVFLWGFGCEGRPFSAALSQSIINWFKNDGCYVVGGVPWGWRDRTGDAAGLGSDWDGVFRSYHAINPWTVGLYTDWAGINSYGSRVTADKSTCDSLGILYMNTFWPRFGWDNMHNWSCGSSRISSRGGQHLWDQIYKLKSLGVACNFLANYDEYDESTAIIKLTDNYPTTGCWFDHEGKGSDWWMRLANQATKMQRGEIGLSQTIPINAATSPDNAVQVSDTIPTSMNPGQSYNVSVTVRNTGETIWNDELFKLGAVGDSDPFGPGRVMMSSGSRVAPPSGEYTFSFTMTAPTQTGTYTSDWQMVHEGIRWFGAQLVKVITVGGGGGGTDNSQYISDTIPTQMTPGQVTNVSVTMKNTGTATWSEAGLYRLGAMNDSDPFYYTNRILLNGGETIAPQAQKQFSFTMTAPATPGTYTTDWQMVHDGVAWFGGTLVKSVVVKNMVSIDLGTNNIQNGMTCPTGGDGDNYAVTQGSVDCRRNTDPNDDYYFYFTVSDSWAYQGSKPNVYIRVRYYDTGGGNIAVQYDATSNPYKSTSAVTVGSTNTWKYATWNVTDAYFGNRQNGGADMRLWLNTGKIRYIDTVEVSTTAF